MGGVYVEFGDSTGHLLGIQGNLIAMNVGVDGVNDGGRLSDRLA